MEPEIIFGESLRGSDSKALRREVYETVEHINKVHPTKITKVVVYINGKGKYVTELWSGGYYRKQQVSVGDNVSAEKGVLYAHLRVSAKASSYVYKYPNTAQKNHYVVNYHGKWSPEVMLALASRPQSENGINRITPKAERECTNTSSIVGHAHGCENFYTGGCNCGAHK